MNSSETAVGSDRFVVGLDAVTSSDLDLVGGKGASLGALVDAGFDVPDGFCVTTHSYDAVATDEIRDAIRLLDDVALDDPALERRAETVRALFRTESLPVSVDEAIRDAVDELGGEDASYAVRSSATAEDLPSASFAGQHETYLGVAPDDVAARVRDCMASLFTDRAVAYRCRNGIDHADVALAVVVQAMVDADAAGVLFTADPETGNRTVASVDAAFGLGESVVAGDVESDNARVSTSTGTVLAYDVGRKETRLSLENGETTRVTLSTDDSRTRVLSDAQLTELVELGTRIEAHLGGPQDVEWALVDDEFVVLQSRPITSLFPLPEPSPTDGRLHVYLSVGHVQAMAEAMPPLAVDVWMAAIDEMFAGFDAGQREQWAVHTGGRVYEEITPFLRYPLLRDQMVTGLEPLVGHAAVGLDELLDRRGDEFSTEFSALDLSLFTSLGRDSVRLGRAVLPLLPGLVSGYCRSFVRAGDDMPRIRQWYRTWGERAAADILADDVSQQAQTVFEGIPFETVELTQTVLPRLVPLAAGMTADSLLRRLFPDEHDTVDAATRGSSEEVGTRMNLGLADLETVAREHPAVADVISEGGSIDDVATVDGGDAFIEELEQFLDVFGHRTAGEFDVSRPRWRDDPSGVLQLVQGNLRSETGDDYRDHLRSRQQAAQEAVDRLESKADRGLLGAVRGPLVRQLLRVARGYIPLRDEPKQGSAHLFTAWHDGLVRVGESLAADGRLDTPEDVWFLRRDELFALLDGLSIAVDIDSRRREHERVSRLDAPALVTSEGESLVASPDESLGDGVLGGTGVSSGVVEGTARVVFDPTESALEPGEILVAPSCDPMWTPLFLDAAGLVTDVGGWMTHGALVAREYGLPAVMSVSGATKRIETGRRVRVDGTRGTVELLG